MKITLLHPSRGRAEKAGETFNYWIEKSSNNPDIIIEHILSIDENDPQKEKYLKNHAFDYSITCINDNTCVVEATNHAAKRATGEILIYLSDDFKCPQDWDKDLINRFEMDKHPVDIDYSHPILGSGSLKIKETIQVPMLIKVDDCLQKFAVAVLTIPIMNRALYEKLGYFWHPGYKSMFVDEDLYWTCRQNNWLMFCEDLKFPHEHVCNGMAENDETYKRSAANWDQGKEFFKQRGLDKFPL